ncbi:uncharacterized protein LOC125747005 isoform X8 [Brienomyrus brachyistius]|uniref:uncharacterized protein LOC125747005 isoform X8 n=1 Tax=Brienomyrus brachyistius TaxID=42636 RepID=UPI0020B44E27|nr:uncharacterized protein LOC125747005 isoform X8 [Brienomyrus brachyistius]
MDPLQQNHQDLRQWLQQNKEVLCQQLSVVQISIIDKAEDILTLKEYRTLIGVTDKSLQIRDLLNTIIRKSSEDCKKFLQIMQQHFPLITELLQSSSQGQCHQFVCAEEGSNVVAPLVSHVNTGPFNMDVTLRTSNELKALDQLDAQKSQNYSACGQTASPCLPKKTPECFIKRSPKSAEERAASIPSKMEFLIAHLSAREM